MPAAAAREATREVQSFGAPSYLCHLMSNPQNPVVFMDINVGSQYIGRLKIELLADKVPKTAENFRQLCTGEFTLNGVPVGYKGSKFHKIINEYMVQGGDFVKGDGTGSLSIYGHSFADENHSVPHSSAGTFGMVNTGANSNGCQFYIITKPSEWLNGKNVAFGRLVDDESQLILEKLQNVSVGDSYKPRLAVTISECGQL